VVELAVRRGQQRACAREFESWCNCLVVLLLLMLLLPLLLLLDLE
jgi:hypothetical protein